MFILIFSGACNLSSKSCENHHASVPVDLVEFILEMKKKRHQGRTAPGELDRKRKQSSRDQFCKSPVAQLDDSDEPAEDEKTHHLHIDS